MLHTLHHYTTAASELMLEMLSNGVTGIRQIIKKWLGKAALASAEGCATEGCAPLSGSKHTKWEVHLVFLLKMQVPSSGSSKVKDHRVTILPGHRLSFYWTTGLHEGHE